MHAVALAICVLMLQTALASAQDTDVPPQPAAQNNADSNQQVDAPQRGLPVSLSRIRSQLAETPPSKPGTGLKIEATVEVVGVAPPIELWDPSKAKRELTGPSPFGPPTQKDILELTTPQEFKRYPFDLNALMQWLADKMSGEKKAE